MSSTSKATAWLRQAGGPPVDHWTLHDVERIGYDVMDVHYRYRYSGEVCLKTGRRNREQMQKTPVRLG